MMKKLQLTLFLLFSLIITLVYAQTTPIPDTNFEQFLFDQGIDTNGINGNILDVDAQSVTTLNVTRNDITDFTGLEAFVNIVTLNTGRNQYPTIPLSTLTLLESFVFNRNQDLDSIDFTQNLALRTINIRSHFDPALSITTLDLSQNLNLESVTIELPSLTSLTFPVTTTLVDIDTYNCSVPVIDLSQLEGNLDYYIIGSHVDVTIIYPNKRDALKRLHLSSIKFPTVDISEMIGLERFGLSSTNTEVVLLPTTTTLTNINISGHELQPTTSFASVPELTSLSISNKRDAAVPLEIDISQNLELTGLRLPRNYMIDLDISQNTKLTSLDVNTNNFTNIDVSTNTSLTTINVSRNQLPVFDVSQNIDLTRLNAANNILPTIDLSTNLKLRDLNLAFNELPTLNITNNIDLGSVAINNNLFTTTGLDLTQNINLYSLVASFNQIESLDITQNPRLSSLYISDNIFPGTNILDQFYTHQVNQGRLGMRLNVENNLLSGRIPDFYSLYSPTVQTRRSSFLFGGNAFEFGDFEDEHLDYVALLTTQSIGPSPDVVFQYYTYAPQAKVNAIETPTRNAGESITLTTTVRGAQNHYKWFKDGVEIADAPDAPEYTITDLNTCDAGVYHSEIISDLVPFENANPPGTDGKNLLLVRNDITLTVNATKDCVTLASPVSGATNIPINTGIEWNDNPGACGYKLSVGTTSGATDIVNNIDVGEVTVYNFASDLPSNQQIFVTITPYYDDGDFGGCAEESFTTNASTVAPDCTTLSSPENGDTDVSIDLSGITWNPANGADAYRIEITSTSGNNNITLTDVGNALTHPFSTSFQNGDVVTVNIIPYNTVGNAIGPCSMQSFTIGSSSPSVPAGCADLASPLANATDVAVDIGNISWDAVAGATAYRITIDGSTSTANDITDQDITGTSFTLPGNFNNGETVSVTVIPFNITGDALGCSAPQNFTITASISDRPDCTMLTSPLNGATNVGTNTNLTWNAANGAENYRISIGTTAGGNDIVNNEIVGNLTTYNPTNDLPENTAIYVSITPYNATGDAVSCTEESFTTASTATVPDCTMLTSPLNGATNVGTNTNLTWNVANGAENYRISIGTTAGGNDIVNNEIVGNLTTYNPTNDLPENTTIYVSITPYNATGDAASCTEESFTTASTPTVPDCTVLTSPLNGATNVGTNTNLTWNAANGAENYRISIGTTAGGNDIVNNEIVGNLTTYNPTNDLPENTTIYVSITPYNATGDAASCTEESFTTASTPTVPDCTVLTSPLNGATNVGTNTDLTWNVANGAENYRISIGTTAGGNDIVNNEIVGNLTTYNPTNDLPENTTIYVSITPYNATGDAVSCTEESFTTASTPTVPDCTMLTSPLNGATNVGTNTNLTWNAANGAENYRISIGTTAGGNDIVNNEIVGNLTTYNPTNDLPENTTIYVSITPYNATGDAVSCSEESFTTASTPTVPDCTVLTSPLNGATNVGTNTNLTWNAANGAENYRISIGTTAGGNDIVNNEIVGNLTTYNPTNDLPENTTIYVSITPYNATGDAASCSEESFKTQSIEDETKYGFSPNNDGQNDNWQIVGIENNLDNIVSIYNRWGDLVYQSKGYNNYSIVFDGTANKLSSIGANELPSGTYFFDIQINGSHNLKKLKGYLILKR